MIDQTAVTEETILWIALPWKYGKGTDNVRISVFASPRLKGAGTDGFWTLANPDGTQRCSFSHWPNLIDTIAFEVQVRGRTLPLAEPVRPVRQWKPELWPLLFGDDTPVDPFGDGGNATTLSVDQATSYSPKRAGDAVRNLYATSGPGARIAAGTSTLLAADDSLNDVLEFHFPSGVPTTSTPDARAIQIRVTPDAHRKVISTVESAMSADTVIEPMFLLPRVADDQTFSVTLVANRDVPLHFKTEDGSQINGAPSPYVVPAGVGRVVATRVTGGWSVVHRLDFHAAVSSLSGYPELLRLLGLVLDLELPVRLDELGDSGFLRVVPTSLATCDTSRRSISPWTAYRVSQAGDARLLATAPLDPSAPTFENGMLVRREERHHIMRLDVDGAALKIHVAKQEAENAAPPGRIATPESESHLPALRHAGLALVDEEAPQDILDALERRRTHEAKLAMADPSTPPDDLPRLFAEDVVVGFRPDVRRDGGAWRSLCARRGDYVLGLPGRSTKITLDSEGHVGEIADESPQQGLRISRALFRWEGWSLGVPRPGRPIDANGDAVDLNDAGPATNVPLHVSFRPRSGTLERLRFGSTYEFRGRMVDIAGNSLALAEADRVSERFASAVFPEAEPFRRLEPVDAPVLMPLQSVGVGETSDHLVIRTIEHECTGAREWAVFPPRTSELMVEMHGVLDGLGAADVWNLVTGLEGDLPRRHATGRGYDAEWIRSHAGGRRGSLRVPYLSDPLSRGAAFCGLPGAASTLTSDFAPPTLSRPLRPDVPGTFRFRLQGGECGAWKDSHGIVVALPPGRMTAVRFSSALHGDDRKYFEIWKWLVDQDPALERTRVEDMLCGGEVEHLTPGKPLVIVHAVDRPLPATGRREIAFDSLLAGPREALSAIVSLDGELAIDAPSTGKVELHAAWTEMLDDPGQPTWSDVRRTAQPFQVLVPHDPPVIDRTAARLDECSTIDGLVTVQGTHRFDDTRHHMVDYHAVATTRFVDYYEGATQDTTGRYTSTSLPSRVNVLSTSQPAQPDVAYIVPAFAVQIEEHRRTRHVRRSGNLLRVYLRRGWFSSGEEEKLAVILAPSQGPVAEKARAFLTEWGTDPIHRGATLTRRPSIDDFPVVSTTHERGETEERMKKIAVVKVPRAKDDGTVEFVTEEIEVDVAAYPVYLDEKKSLLYADIEVRTGRAYFPFVRLALARYQPYSIDRAFLSQIVRAAFVQVAPTRALTVKRTGSREYAIRVTGPTYETDIGRENVPDIAATVEVSVERKVSGLGRSDADWFPLLTPGPIRLRRTADGDGWEGVVSVDGVDRYEHRLVVRELEHYVVDAAPGATSAATACRLVYAQLVRLEEL